MDFSAVLCFYLQPVSEPIATPQPTEKYRVYIVPSLTPNAGMKLLSNEMTLAEVSGHFWRTNKPLELFYEQQWQSNLMHWLCWLMRYTSVPSSCSGLITCAVTSWQLLLMDIKYCMLFLVTQFISFYLHSLWICFLLQSVDYSYTVTLEMFMAGKVCEFQFESCILVH